MEMKWKPRTKGLAAQPVISSASGKNRPEERCRLGIRRSRVSSRLLNIVAIWSIVSECGSEHCRMPEKALPINPVLVNKKRRTGKGSTCSVPTSSTNVEIFSRLLRLPQKAIHPSTPKPSSVHPSTPPSSPQRKKRTNHDLPNRSPSSAVVSRVAYIRRHPQSLVG